MMDVREKLVEILKQAPFEGKVLDEWWREEKIKRIADYLISNGVTVHEFGCPYCCDNDEGHGMLKHSYDDKDGMEMSIHPSTRNENGYQSQAWWATVHFRGEYRDFYIEVCPLCGRRLVPLKEERQTAMPHPPKENNYAKEYSLKKCNNLVNDWRGKVIKYTCGAGTPEEAETNCTYFIRGECTASFCEYRRKKQTNADCIRAMTDDELNELFHDIYNAGAEDAVAYEWGQRANSFEWTMEWLQQPPKGE